MPRKDAGSGPISAQAQQDLVSEGIENFELPKTLVTKIAKSAIPDNTKLQKETVLSLVKGSTVFINYLAATAHDVALSKQHKSISASDVLKALEMIEFGDLVDRLQEELQIYRDNAKGDKGRKSGATASSKGKAKESESVSTTSRTKGKEKASLPPAFTTVPRVGMSSSISQSTVQDLDQNVAAGEDAEMAGLIGGGDGDGDGEEDEIEDVGEYDEEDEEPTHQMTVEEDLEGDADGLDSSQGDLGEE
ncbi:hypothetical protein ID866_11914 [Astraeus odoratus]|nr:hypothetical protein ID866_11914 [Astraeus odoratus]